MKHIYRFLASFLLAVILLLAGGQEFNLFSPENLGLAGIAFLLGLLILYFDRVFPSLGRKRLAGLALGLLCGLFAGYSIEALVSALGMQAKTLTLLFYLVSTLFFGYVGLHLPFRGFAGEEGESGERKWNARPKLLDTSVIIDGRIMDIAETKFVEGPFIVPNYVLREMQLISDSSDAIKRNRGRRGLDMLNKLQKRKDIEIRISYKDYTDIREVDAKLTRMAREMDAYLVTNDFNLNKVAALQKVEVLNLNSLTGALKPIVLPGENIPIDIVKEGKDENQGIGYMEDGTMVVVENGSSFVGKKAEVNVSSVIQTAAGKMIFTRAQHVIEDSDERPSEGHGGNGRRGRGRGERRPQRSRR